MRLCFGTFFKLATQAKAGGKECDLCTAILKCSGADLYNLTGPEASRLKSGADNPPQDVLNALLDADIHDIANAFKETASVRGNTAYS